jgi:hypothetical protein
MRTSALTRFTDAAAVSASFARMAMMSPSSSWRMTLNQSSLA